MAIPPVKVNPVYLKSPFCKNITGQAGTDMETSPTTEISAPLKNTGAYFQQRLKLPLGKVST